MSVIPDANTRNNLHSWVYTLKDTWDLEARGIIARGFSQTVLMATHVFLRQDSIRRSLEPPYTGLYQIVSPCLPRPTTVITPTTLRPNNQRPQHALGDMSIFLYASPSKHQSPREGDVGTFPWEDPTPRKKISKIGFSWMDTPDFGFLSFYSILVKALKRLFNLFSSAITLLLITQLISYSPRVETGKNA
jgi:hypothetical protein